MVMMKLRRRSKFPDLRGLPLDGVDMFLLSRLEGELTLAQLVDLVPVCEPQETELRVYQLARLGLIEGPPVRAAVPPAAPQPVTAPAPAAPITTPAPAPLALKELASEQGEGDEGVTVRPPPMKISLDAMDAIITAPPPSADYEEMATLPPPPKSQLRANPLLESERVDADQTARIRPRL